jgi:hypothetical protein
MLNGRSGYPCPIRCAVPYGGIVFVFRRYRAPVKAELFLNAHPPQSAKGCSSLHKEPCSLPFTLCLPSLKEKMKNKRKSRPSEKTLLNIVTG